jgi:hypothetical protein
MFEYAKAILREELEFLERLISETDPIKSMKKASEIYDVISILEKAGKE